MTVKLPFEISSQPDDLTCGPTCLHAVYQYFGEQVALPQVIREVAALSEGGTLGVFLACHALRRGYRAKIYTYNLHVFDPTWLSGTIVDLPDRLRQQARLKHDPKLTYATEGYLEYLELGGRIVLEDLTSRLIRRHLRRGEPILTGLSATLLYREVREYGVQCIEDDVRGFPAGHFVVLCGYDPGEREVLVADPLQPNPFDVGRIYRVSIDRLINAILLGVLTYDANLLVLTPPAGTRG